MIGKLILAGATLSVLAGAASAGDMTDITPFDWSGPYIGLQGGHAWGENDAAAAAGGEVIGSARSADVQLGDGNGSIAVDGFVLGLHAGYGWQSGALVLGLEGDLEYAGLRGDTDVFSGPVQAGEIRHRIDWLGSLRARAGFALDRALFYATGGVATGGAKITSDDSQGNELHDNDDTLLGWTAGGGLDYALTDTISARIEYRYTDLGKIDSGDADKSDGLVEADNRFHAVRAGLSWHF